MNGYWEKLKQALWARRHQYQLCFRSPPGQEVLKDLARFCRAHESTFHADPRAHAMAEGRREVWLRIQQHLNLSPDQLWELYSGRPAQEN
jgi:hypothetical protein